MNIREASEADLPRLVKLATLLWPDEDRQELETTFKETFYRPHEITFVAEARPDQLVGLSIFSLRSDYVEGADTSPTGYLEAIIVEEALRGSGLARRLVEKGVEWCKHHGCTQLGSDVELENKTSQTFHQKIGFTEVNRLVCYIKDI